MNIFVLQLVAAVFTIFALSRAYLRFKERKLSSFAFIFWMLIWLLGSLAILFPETTTKVARLVGIGRGVDALLYGSVVVIFYLIFRIYIKIEDTQKQITELTRKFALRKYIKPRKKRLAK